MFVFLVIVLFFFLFLVIGAVLIVIWTLNSTAPSERDRPPVRHRSSSPAPDPAPNPQIRIVQDGFWLLHPGLPAGSRVRYRCLLGSRVREDTIASYPGSDGHFVYTGETPAEIVILAQQAGLDRSGADDLSDSFDNDDPPMPRTLLDSNAGEGIRDSDPSGSSAPSGPGDSWATEAEASDAHTSLDSGDGGSFGDPPAY
jgi:hypothetical protein